jgi:DNA-binding response OmpR family regulator
MKIGDSRTMKTLLVVDDEETMRRLLRINLEDRYEIVDTGKPEEALALAMQGKPSAILLDLRMPNYSGLELCRTFKSMACTQLVPLIVISAEGGGNTKLLCKELGATAYFEKPVDFKELRAVLENALLAAQPERRSEARVRLRVMLQLRGTDRDDKPFDEVSATENVSHSAFLCGSTAPLKQDSTIEVHLLNEGAKFVGQARVIRLEGCDTRHPRYALRFVTQEGEWILQ